MSEISEITLKAARINAGMSQAEVAGILDVAPSTIRNWERGVTEPRLQYFVTMCRLYGVPCDRIKIKP